MDKKRKLKKSWTTKISLLCLIGGILWVSGYAAAFPAFAGEGGISVDDGPPQLTYTGDLNGSSVEWETGGAFSVSWSITELLPDKYTLYWNQTTVNTTYTSGDYTTTVSGSYDPVLSDVGSTIFFNLHANDSLAKTNTSIIYFTVVNTNPPTVQVTSPSNNTYSTPTIPIRLTSPSYDVAMYWFSIYYSLNDSLYEGNTTWIASVDRVFNDNFYYIKAYVNDTAGLEGTVTVYFTITSVVIIQGGSPGFTIPTPPTFDVEYTQGADVDSLFPVLGMGVIFVAAIYWYLEKQQKERSPAATRKAYKIAKKEAVVTNGFWNYYEKENNKKKKKKRRKRLRR